MAGRSSTRAGRSSHPAPPTQAVVASSAHYTGAEAPQVYGTDQGWQRECYRYYSVIGEARYAANYYGNMLGKCSLFMAEPVLDEKTRLRKYVPAWDSTEQQWLDDVFSGRQNQSQMLTSIGLHLAIGGECFLVGRQTEVPPGYEAFLGDGTMIWEVVAPIEMATTGGAWAMRFPGKPDLVLTEQDHVIRIWRPDPYQRFQADSPFKSMLPVLGEIENLTKHIHSQLISRLSGAGMMFVPDGMDFPPGPGETDESTANGPTRLMKLIADVGAKAIENQGSAAARVPIIIQVPDELVDKVGKIVHFWTPLDEHAMPMRAAAIHRFALGMDLPPESTEGMSSNPGTGGGNSNGVSHWGAWQVEESTIKMHAEPALELTCNAITVDYIRVMVPGSRKVVRFSTEGLKLRPDRSELALSLNDRYLLSDAAALREAGFDTGDQMTDEEIRRKVLLKIASGSASPEQVAAANRILGNDLPDGAAEAGVAPELPAAPSLDALPERPRTPEERRAAALLPVCHGMVLQALARVGNRLMNQKAGKVVPPPEVPTYAVHTFAMQELDADRLLADAFPMANEMLEGIADPADVMPTLQRYAAALVHGRREHSREEMLRWLDRTEVPA